MQKLIYWTVWSLARSVVWVFFGLKMFNRRHVPVTGPVIVAANHQSYLDPPVVAVSISREVHFFAKEELFRIFGLGWLIATLNAIPVRRGVYDPRSIKRVLTALEQGGALVLFPEGTRGNGVEFLRPKPGIGLIASHAKVPIVPAYIRRTARSWKTLWRRRIYVIFGEPITAEQVSRYPDDREGYQALADFVMERIGRLREAGEEG
ncbi:MAG: lysophospholipid acyltransferase family protein [candidate division Zixibacteria bacterium]|nr:lysophospholipid acyltransferase family protein [candidate division Zixibacteria bacterium]